MHFSWFGLPYLRKPLTSQWKTTTSDCRHVCRQPAMDILNIYCDNSFNRDWLLYVIKYNFMWLVFDEKFMNFLIIGIELLKFLGSYWWKWYSSYKNTDKYTKICVGIGMCWGNNLGNFELHRFTTSENIAKSLRGDFFDSHCRNLRGGYSWDHCICCHHQRILGRSNMFSLCPSVVR